MKRFRLALAALNQMPLDWDGNLANILSAVTQAREKGASILLLPELCISGYGCEDSFFGGDMQRQALVSLRAVAEASEGMAVVVGLPFMVENTTYNVAAVLADGEVRAIVPKQHLAGDGLHYEPRWFKAWPPGLRRHTSLWGRQVPLGEYLLDFDGLRMAVEICEDAWRGDRPAVRYYGHSVDLIVNPSASHFAFGKTRTRQDIVRESSRAFACIYAFANLVGNEAGRVIYDGELMVAHNGTLKLRNTLCQLAPVQLQTVDLDLAGHRPAQRKIYALEPNVAPDAPAAVVPTGMALPDIPADPALHHIPTPAPTASKAQEFYDAVTLGLWDYLRRTRARGFVISLSGGADSAACAVLCAEALRRARRELPAEAFRAALPEPESEGEDEELRRRLDLVYQRTANSTDTTEQAAEALAENLGARFHIWDVDPAISAYRQMVETSLGRELSWTHDDLALQNIQSRVRAPGIWMLTNVRGALLITTGNRSEGAVGYNTMDGDTSGGLAPIAGVNKDWLLDWLKWAEENLQLPGLAGVNAQQPTAELRPQAMGQTDEADLMPFHILTRIEEVALRQYQPPVAVFQTLRGIAPDLELAAYIRRFFTLWARNQWKRERFAPSFHLDEHSLDPRTWYRFPILSGGFRKELHELDMYLAALLGDAGTDQNA